MHMERVLLIRTYHMLIQQNLINPVYCKNKYNFLYIFFKFFGSYLTTENIFDQHLYDDRTYYPREHQTHTTLCCKHDDSTYNPRDHQTHTMLCC
jgi:hypothetical protein